MPENVARITGNNRIQKGYIKVTIERYQDILTGYWKVIGMIPERMTNG